MAETAIDYREPQGDAAPGIHGGGGFPFQHVLKVDNGRQRRRRHLPGQGRRQGLGQENRQQYAHGQDSLFHDSTLSGFLSNLKMYPNYRKVPSCEAKLMGGAANPGPLILLGAGEEFQV